MSKDERSPQEWRELLRNANYPEEIRRTKGRRARRQARREHTQEVRRQTIEYVRAERRREPIRPAAAVITIAVILALGVGARFLWPNFVGDGGGRATVIASPTPTGKDDEPGTGTDTSPPPSPSSSSADRSDPEHVAKETVRIYLTRNPPKDKEHSASALRAEPYMTPALVKNLASSSDPAWDKLVSRGDVTTVRSVEANPAGDELPTDSPLRVWRKIVARVHVVGYETFDETTSLRAEVTKTDDGWRVSRILGL